MKTTLSMQCGVPYIPIPKGRGFTANPDKGHIPRARQKFKFLGIEFWFFGSRIPALSNSLVF